MPQKIYIVDGRQFRTESDQKLALRDKQLMERLESSTDFSDYEALKRLLQDLKAEKYRFYTILGQDFREKVEETLKEIEKEVKKADSAKNNGNNGKMRNQSGTSAKENRKPKQNDKLVRKNNENAKEAAEDKALIEKMARDELKRIEKRRKRAAYICFLLGSACILYFAFYFLQSKRTQDRFREMAQARENSQTQTQGTLLNGGETSEQKETVKVNLDPQNKEKPDVLEKYRNLYNSNKKLIGWLKIDDTIIDYPVMQTSDNEYYLKHNVDQQEDRNGALFMDKDCKAYPQSTNLIVYGHHMQSGVMFGTLDKYSSKDFYEKHKVIEFDTIYEEGIYDVMYVFRSKIYNEDDMVFKYYQFTDALSEQEFDSYMDEMERLALYDTGINAQFGDHLLTLSTCDYYVKDGRFVVVAKKREE